MITRRGKHGKVSNFRKIVSATLLSALVGAFFVQAPMQMPAYASSDHLLDNFSNSRDDEQGPSATNNWPGWKISGIIPGTNISGVNLQMESDTNNAEDLKIMFYSSARDVKYGELNLDTYDTDTHVTSSSGSLTLPSGAYSEIWVVIGVTDAFASGISISTTFDSQSAGAWEFETTNNYIQTTSSGVGTAKLFDYGRFPIMQISGSAPLFSNLNRSSDGWTNQAYDDQLPVAIMMEAPAAYAISEVKLELLQEQAGGSEYFEDAGTPGDSSGDRRVYFYGSTADAPSELLGFFTATSFDDSTGLHTYSTGAPVEIPSGKFWISFQCDGCANTYWANTSTPSNDNKTGVIDYSLTDSGNIYRAYFDGVDDAFDTPSVVYSNGASQNGLAPSIQITGSLSADTTAPTIASSTPIDGATGVLTGADIVLNFDEPVAKGTTGNISIVRTSDDSAQVIDVTSGAVTVSGSTVTVNPGTDLDSNTAYHVLVDSTAIVDIADTPNAFAGISTNTVLNFTTIAPPAVATSTPSDDATGVDNTANIVLNFDRNVTAQTGKNITIVNTSDASDNRVIAADDAQVTVSSSAVTINPTNDLKINSNYAVIFDAGAFQDGNSIPVDALTDQTTLNFTTAPFSFNGLTVALDAEFASSTDIETNDKWLDLSGNDIDLDLQEGLDNSGLGGPTLQTNGDGTKAINFLRQSNDDRRGDYGIFVERSTGTARADLLNAAEYTKLVWMKPNNKFERMNILTADDATHNFWFGYDKNSSSACANDFDSPRLAAAHQGEDCYSTVQAQTDIETNQWQLGVVTFSADGDSALAGQKLYVNGSLVDEDSTATNAPVDGYNTHLAAYGTGNTFDGQIGQVYIYDRALDSTEINEIFEATAGTFGLNRNTVTFNPNGGTVDLASIKTFSDGTVTLRTPTKTNATFLGWYTASTGGTKVGDAGDSYDPNGNDVTLFAQWDNTYTVTYSAGTNATGAPASVLFKDSTGPVTLPTPSRDDYEFDGWYTASTGGTKVGNAGDNYTATNNVTLHGQWTQLSLAGISPADLTLVNSDTIVAGVASSTSRTIGSSSVTLNVPAGAFDPGVVVRLYSVANHNKAQAVLTNESDFVNSMVVAWTATDTTVPVANSDLTMVITDASIKSGAKVYSILGDQSTLLATATQDGSVTIAFDTDPLVTIANPAPAPAPQNNSGGGGGGGGGAPAPVTTTATEVTPTLDEDQVIEIDEDKEETVLLTGTGLDQIDSVKHGETELSFEVSESSEQVTLTIPASIAGEMNLQFMFEEDMLEHSIMVMEVIDPSVVNAGTFKGVVAIYAKNFEGKRLSAKVGKDWVVVDSLESNFVRVLERVRWIGYDLAVRIFIDRKLIRTVDLVTE